MGSVKNREAAKYSKDCKRLVKSVTDFNENEEDFQTSMDFVISNLLFHSFLDADSYHVTQKISRLHEKFLINSDLNRAKRFYLASQKLLHYYKANSSLTQTGVSILAFLLHLAESTSNSNGNFNSEILNSVKEVPAPINWASYLREDDFSVEPFSDTDSEALSISLNGSSEEESLEEVLSPELLHPPPRDDSGLGVSPDSASSGHFHGVHNLSIERIIEEKPIKRNLETFYPYWVPRYQKTYGSSPYNMLTMNFTRIWREHLAQLHPSTIIERKVVVHERNVIKEVLWMLTGIQDLFIVQWSGRKFIPNSHIHLTNLTSSTLRYALEEICESATRKSILCDCLKEIVSSSSHSCETYRAYAHALLEELQRINDCICELDRHLRKCDGTFTLLILHDRLHPICDAVSQMWEIHTEAAAPLLASEDPFSRACHVLHVLWNCLLQHSVQELCSNGVKLIFRVFLKTLRPFFNFLEQLTVLGSFNDLHGEFFIRETDKVRTDDTFWEGGLELRPLPEYLARDFFIQPFLSDILSAGKSIAVLSAVDLQLKKMPFHLNAQKGDLYSKFIHIIQKLVYDKTPLKLGCKDVKDVKDEGGNISCSTDPLLEEKLFSFSSLAEKFFRPNVNPFYKTVSEINFPSIYSDKEKLTNRIIEFINPNSLKPITKAVIKSLAICIEFVHRPVCKRLMHTLRHDHHLLNCLAVMRKYFLMESGDVMFSFYSEVFTKMSPSGKSWENVSFLYSALQNAVAEDKENSEKLCIFLNLDNPGINPKQPLSNLNALQLSFDVAWPVSAVLGAREQNEYLQVFSFLLQVKCAKFHLDKLHHIPLCTNLPKSQAQRVLMRSTLPRQQKAHGMHIIRMRLLFFVNGLHNYLMTRILHSFGVEFCNAVETAETVDDLLIAHKHYLKSLQERCLLDPRLLHLRKEIVHVLNISYVFSNLWSKGIDRVHVGDLASVEEEFSKASNFLQCSFNAPLRRGVFIHLESLVSLMLSDTHWQYIFAKKK